jgi:hypothetical protein
VTSHAFSVKYRRVKRQLNFQWGKGIRKVKPIYEAAYVFPSVSLINLHHAMLNTNVTFSRNRITLYECEIRPLASRNNGTCFKIELRRECLDL